MSTTTPNIGLTKPSKDENVDVDVFNDNFDKIDEKLGNKYIVESGTTDGWHWEKWSDGTTKAKTTTGLQKGIACTTAYGGLFHSNIKTITVPASLISAVTDVIPRIITTNGVVHIVTCGVVDNVISYYVVNGLSSTGVTTNIMFEVEGVSAN